VRARHRATGEVDVVEVSVGHAVQVDAAGSAPLSLSAGGEREQGRPWPSGLRVGAAPGRRVPSLAATPEKGVCVCVCAVCAGRLGRLNHPLPTAPDPVVGKVFFLIFLFFVECHPA